MFITNHISTVNQNAEKQGDAAIVLLRLIIVVQL